MPTQQDSHLDSVQDMQDSSVSHLVFFGFMREFDWKVVKDQNVCMCILLPT